MAKINLTEYITIENNDGTLTVNKEGIEKQIEAMQQQLGELKQIEVNTKARINGLLSSITNFKSLLDNEERQLEQPTEDLVA